MMKCNHRLVICFWSINRLIQSSEQLLTASSKALVSSYLRHPATRSGILSKKELYLPSVTQTRGFLAGREKFRTEEIEVTFTWPFLW